MTLEQLGWDDFFAQAFAPHAAAGCVPARITLELKGYFEVTGATGARLLLTLTLELRRRKGRYGLAAACIGGGQGIAVIIENEG